MGIDQIVLIVLIAALLLASVNLYTFWSKRQSLEAKKRLKNLYYPLHSIIAKKNKYVIPLKKSSDDKFEEFAVEYYRYFLELRNRYLENKICESPKLAKAFGVLTEMHGLEAYDHNKQSYLPEDVTKHLALSELSHQIDKDGLSKLERNLQAVENIIESEVSRMTKRV
ncbi:MAG: hypothetical protein U9R26_07650 [Campylobacterota bacterium]|nr:hypothetical protein [Campylobacterota bacterium]